MAGFDRLSGSLYGEVKTEYHFGGIVVGRILDSNNPNDVASTSRLEVDIDVPNRKMVIFSGIAIPEWSVFDDDDNLQDTYTVNLHYPVLAVDQATMAVGLASVGNGDTDFLFACDATELDIDPITQELSLKVSLANRGNPSALNRFSYQVVVTAVTAVTQISGTIYWDKSIFMPKTPSGAVYLALFQVTADTFYTPPSDGFSTEVLTIVARGKTLPVVEKGNDFAMPYEISAAPFNTPLKVAVVPGHAFATAPGNTLVTQISGPRPLTLTPANATISGVDFRVQHLAPPR